MKEPKITDFINGPVSYDENGGGYIWVNDPKGGIQMLGEVRGWGHIQNMKHFKGDMKAAREYQDEIGRFITDAINEKIKRDF